MNPQLPNNKIQTHCDLLDAAFCWMLNWQGLSIHSQLPTEKTTLLSKLKVVKMTLETMDMIDADCDIG